MWQKTLTVPPTKPLSDDDPVVRLGFGGEAVLPLIQDASTVPPYTNKLYFYNPVWEYQFHTDIASDWSY